MRGERQLSGCLSLPPTSRILHPRITTGVTPFTSVAPMVDLFCTPFVDMIQRMRLEFRNQQAMFDLPVRKWFVPDVSDGAADLWQECQIETVTFCSPEGCKDVEPTLKIFLGDYTAPDGKKGAYYYRCRRDGPCDRIEDPWIGYNSDYRVFVVREAGVISRVRQDGRSRTSRP